MADSKDVDRCKDCRIVKASEGLLGEVLSALVLKEDTDRPQIPDDIFGKLLATDREGIDQYHSDLIDRITGIIRRRVQTVSILFMAEHLAKMAELALEFKDKDGGKHGEGTETT